jgi:hypothetical protein
MAIRNIRRVATVPGGYVGTTNAAPIYVDSDDNQLKVVPGGQGSTTEVAVMTGVSVPITLSTATALTANAHAGRTLVTSGTAGFTVTLPAATGTGAKYRIIIGTTMTSSSFVLQVANGTDYFRGVAVDATDTAGTANTWATANTGTVATESDTLTWNRTTTGVATQGDWVEVEDIATAVWRIQTLNNASGAEATPFTVAV